MTSPAATRRSRLDFAARSLQPTQVRIGGIPGTGRSARMVITFMSLPCPRVSDTGRGPAPTGPLAGAAGEAEEAAGIRPYSGACATGPADERTAGPSAGTAASDLMSMRQPVSLAASLAFWPSLPIA